MDFNRIVNVATHAGKIMLESGAEIYRVEETMLRICNAWDIHNADTFVTPTVLMISIPTKYGEPISIIKRIKKRTVNLEKISQVNDISRHIQNKGLTLEMIEDRLSEIESSKAYSNRLNILLSGVAAGFFTLVFNGNLRDFLVALFIGCGIRIISLVLSNLDANDFFINILCGSFTALTALALTHLGISSHSDKIIIGSIMLLVPGLAITNAIRDTISGDLLSGITRGIEAFLIAVGIALGTGVVLKFWISYFGGVGL
ncbi:threonine/serine exporter family protein [Clostridium thailandense]|uniref:Threonine/serine exporter family protein n=1 Tax=Clostridium thailandense TaxID=2794346 RepID=A0A949U0Y9_9CLOT|nr:threonine/serine exporter family protein [Clostridium thailandense]MBV7274438.1 threonine/serine exporter family protein [Clostridium thailandense]MCH5136624.1 threonine/serine exporter family protein [Clostridiaceae bacterium UIB06]